MKVLMLAKRFPKFHRSSGFETGFAEKFLSGEKCHTCRLNERGYFKTGDVVSVRQWSGVPYRSRQVVLRDGVGITVYPVEIMHSCCEGQHSVTVRVGGAIVDAVRFIYNDGLSLEDFIDWFFPHWRITPVRYWRGSVISFNGRRYDIA